MEIREFIEFFRELIKGMSAKTRRLFLMAGALAVVCLLITGIGHMTSGSKASKIAPELEAFDEWAAENLSVNVTERTLTVSKDIDNYGAYTSPTYMETLLRSQMYQRLFNLASEEQDARKEECRKLRTWVDTALDYSKKYEMDGADSLRVLRSIDELNIMEKMTGKKVPDEVVADIGYMLHKSRSDCEELARGEGKMLEFMVRVEGDERTHRLIFVSPRDVLALQYFDEI